MRAAASYEAGWCESTARIDLGVDRIDVFLVYMIEATIYLKTLG